jgi:hypothetical protein
MRQLRPMAPALSAAMLLAMPTGVIHPISADDLDWILDLAGEADRADVVERVDRALEDGIEWHCFPTTWVCA